MPFLRTHGLAIFLVALYASAPPMHADDNSSTNGSATPATPALSDTTTSPANPAAQKGFSAKVSTAGTPSTTAADAGSPNPRAEDAGSPSPTAIDSNASNPSGPAANTGTGNGSALSDKPIPLKFQNFPVRPRPLLEIGGSPFLSTGPIGNGFEIPTGAVWQPEFLVFGTSRTAIQTFDDGSKNYSDFSARLDLFGNLYLTPTERLLIGVRPLDRDGPMSSGYQFNNTSGFQNVTNINVRTLFFEGDFGEIFPNLDPNDDKSLDYGFSIGRQPLNFEDGIMINDDEVDAFAVTRTSLFALGASAIRTTALFGWGDINRNDNLQAGAAKLFGLFSTADYAKSTVNVDLAYVNDPSGDGFYTGVGSTQRFFGHLDTTFRVNTSVALDQNSAAVSTGTLLFAQLSTPLPHSKDVLYLNTFWGIDDYSSAARDPNAQGPLGQIGLLFAAQGVGRYGAPLGNRADDSAGAALGWQHYLGSTDQQLTFELGGRANTGNPKYFEQPAAEAAAARYQMKLNQHCVLIFDTFVGFPDSLGTAYGARSELLVKF